MPPGLIEHEHGMGTRINGLADLAEMLLHCPRVAIRQDETGTFSFLRADRPEDVCPHRSLIVWCGWSGSSPRPSPSDLVLLPYSGFVGPPDFDVRTWRLFLPDLYQSGGEVFLKTSPSNSF
ncbi:hypothetical protein EV561_1724 [Rhizobium sp. BK376]|nr:hypothetical protein EV561_1724 [Rhizobium sp. BK376]